MSPDGPFSESPWKIILLSREQQHQSRATHREMPENTSTCIMAFWEGLVLYFLIPSMDFFHCLRACGAEKTGKELGGQTLELQGDLFVHEPQSKHSSPP